MTGQPGWYVRVAYRTRCVFATGRDGAIRVATLTGGVLAFVWLCCLSPSAHAGPPGGASVATAIGVPLAMLTLVSLGGWYRAHRHLARCRDAQQHSREAEIRAYAARGSDAAQAARAFERERARLVGEMHAFAAGPLAALAALVGSLDATRAPSREQARIRCIQSAAGTCAHVLDAVLATLSHPLPPVVLDEEEMDVRALIEGVVALLEPAAAQKGARLNVHIDATLAERVLADRARLGQIVYGLASRAVTSVERGMVTVLAHAEVLNAGSQRIFISVSHACGPMPARAPQAGADAPSAFDAPTRGSGPHDDAAFALYRDLAHRMQGELAIDDDGGHRTCVTFSAAFPIGRAVASGESEEGVATGDDMQESATRHRSPDAYDRRYLDALSEEGIDLPAFLGRWRESMQDDLLQMSRLRGRGDAAAIRALLHRLSGAVGLVGAQGLTEALRQASAAQAAPDAPMLDALAHRIEGLMAQLDAERDAGGARA